MGMGFEMPPTNDNLENKEGRNGTEAEAALESVRRRLAADREVSKTAFNEFGEIVLEEKKSGRIGPDGEIIMDDSEEPFEDKDKN